MTLQNTIPVSKKVPKYPDSSEELTKWGEAVATYCNGSQVLKKNQNIYLSRTGSRVHIEGFIDLVTSFDIEVLRPVPRLSGFITVLSESGTLSYVKYTKDSPILDISQLVQGEKYFINGSYFSS